MSFLSFVLIYATICQNISEIACFIKMPEKRKFMSTISLGIINPTGLPKWATLAILFSSKYNAFSNTQSEWTCRRVFCHMSPLDSGTLENSHKKFVSVPLTCTVWWSQSHIRFSVHTWMGSCINMFSGCRRVLDPESGTLESSLNNCMVRLVSWPQAP